MQLRANANTVRMYVCSTSADNVREKKMHVRGSTCEVAVVKSILEFKEER